MNSLHSEHCHCECDKLANKIRLIIGDDYKPSLMFMMIQNALNGVCHCPPELLYKGDHYGYCGKL
jgi:hypothetical protein